MKGHQDAGSVGCDAYAACPTQFKLDPRHVSLAAAARRSPTPRPTPRPARPRR